jgi:hypothetical protein
MGQKYYNFMREFNRDKGYTSFYGSNKKEFLDAWARSKGTTIKPRPEIAENTGMGAEDINRAGDPFKKPIPIEKIKEAVSNLPPVSEGVKALSKSLTSKEFDDAIEEGVKDLYHSQFPFPDMVSKDKLYKDKFLTLSKKKQEEIRNLVRKQLTKQFIIGK